MISFFEKIEIFKVIPLGVEIMFELDRLHAR